MFLEEVFNEDGKALRDGAVVTETMRNLDHDCARKEPNRPAWGDGNECTMRCRCEHDQVEVKRNQLIDLQRQQTEGDVVGEAGSDAGNTNQATRTTAMV